MKLDGFIGPAYTNRSVNVDAQRAVNIYPEVIESGRGKEGRVSFYAPTPGLTSLLTVGSGPIRLIHRDSIGRVYVVSGNELYRVSKRADWEFSLYYRDAADATGIDQSTDVNTTTDVITSTSHNFYSGLKVQVSSNNTLPTGLSASTDYWVIVADANTFKLASSVANAAAGTQIDITGTGTGTMAVTPTAPPSDVRRLSVDDDVDYDNDNITKTAHGLYTGGKIYVGTFATPIPTGLTVGDEYWVAAVDADTIKLCSSLSNAVAETAVDLTTTSGTWNATIINSTGETSTANDANLSTSSGAVRAASMSIDGANEYSTTVLTDGTDNYIIYDDPTDTSAFGVYFESGDGDENLLPASFTTSHIVWIDGFFVVNEVGTNKFYTSDLQGVTINSLDFASSEGSPDLVQGLIDNHRALWVFNEHTTEIYVNTGNADFPFERVQGGFLEVGCLAKYSIAKVDGTIFWLGQSEDGQGIVYAAQGFNFKRVSTHAIETAIQGYASPSAATAYTYQDGGHKFYVLNFAEATWVYDLSTGLWHERAYTNSGTLERQRGECHAFAYGVHLVGDYSDNNLFQYDDAVYEDNGDAITRLRTTPHVSKDLKRILYHKFQLDMEVGIGLDGGVQGSQPTVMLDWSDDGGHTWSSESWALADAQAGDIGEYKTRVIWRRLGQSRDRIFRVKMTDPVKCVLIGAHIEATPGRM